MNNHPMKFNEISIGESFYDVLTAMYWLKITNSTAMILSTIYRGITPFHDEDIVLKKDPYDYPIGKDIE